MSDIPNARNNQERDGREFNNPSRGKQKDRPHTGGNQTHNSSSDAEYHHQAGRGQGPNGDHGYNRPERNQNDNSRPSGYGGKGRGPPVRDNRSFPGSGKPRQDQGQGQLNNGSSSSQRYQGPRHTNSRSDSSHVHKAPIDPKFKSHGRQNLHKRPTPIQRVSIDAQPSQAVLKNLAGSNLTVPSASLEEVMKLSHQFWDQFPSETARLHMLCKNGVDKGKLGDFVNSVYPIVHHTCLDLILNFLEHKRRYGSNPERRVYADMDIVSFIDRLMKKRPLSFLGQDDHYYLPNFKEGFGGFEAIGTDNESPPLVLENFLSYDEMRISALLSLSSWSWFVNDGRRKNFGKKDPDDRYQTEGVIVGQVGARLRKEGVMEYLDCVITRRQNNPDKGFGDAQTHVNVVWSKFWGGQLPTYKDANACLQVQRGGELASAFEYLALGDDNIFNITVYKKRIAITAEILLCEANTRAQAYGKKAYVHVVGLGLGVWRAFEEQDELYVEAWGDAMRNIKDFSHIAFVDFSFINCSSIHSTRNNEKFPGTDVVVRFSNRNLHDKVPQDCILVCNYAWDGNSLPGNEFWLGKLCSTGDSAAACSSCVAEIHTHSINPVVSGTAVRVATKEGKLLDVADYLKKMNGAAPDMRELNRYGAKSSCSAGAAVCSPNERQEQVEGRTHGPKQTMKSLRAEVPVATRESLVGSVEVPSGDGVTTSWANHANQTNPPIVDRALADTRIPPTSEMPIAVTATPNTAGDSCPKQLPVNECSTIRDDSVPRGNGSLNSETATSEGSAAEPSNSSTSVVAIGGSQEKTANTDAHTPKLPTAPEEIQHPTIPGCMIENPEYKKQLTEYKKQVNKSKKAQKNSSQKQSNEANSSVEQLKKSNENRKKSGPKQKNELNRPGKRQSKSNENQKKPSGQKQDKEVDKPVERQNKNDENRKKSDQKHNDGDNKSVEPTTQSSGDQKTSGQNQNNKGSKSAQSQKQETGDQKTSGQNQNNKGSKSAQSQKQETGDQKTSGQNQNNEHQKKPDQKPNDEGPKSVQTPNISGGNRGKKKVKRVNR